jgi:hypothetical protein
MIRLILAMLTLGLLGCMSTKIVFDGRWNPSSKPSYEDYMDSYLFGFLGHPQISLTKICMDQKPLALQRVKSAEDIFLNVITLGIYTPTTVNVWCGD